LTFGGYDGNVSLIPCYKFNIQQQGNKGRIRNSMKESQEIQAHCQCGAIEIKIQNTPIVHATCHCEDCRDLLDIPLTQD